MAGPDSSKRLSPWPKLLLWGVVIVAGVLYLGVIRDKGSEDRPTEGSVQTEDRAPGGDVDTGKADPAAEAPIAPLPASDSNAQPQRVLTREVQPTPRLVEPVIVEPDTPSVWSAQMPPPTAESAAVPGVIARPRQTAPKDEPVDEAAAEPAALPVPAAVESGSAEPFVQPESAETPGSDLPAVAATPASAVPQVPGGGSELAVEVPAHAPALVPPLSPQTPAKTDDQAGAPEPVQARLRTRDAYSPASIGGTDLDRGTPVPKLPMAPPRFANPSGPAMGLPAEPVVPYPIEARAPGPDVESFQEQRARIMAEYRAKQRWYRERMWRYWEFMDGLRSGHTGPYGAYPGYAPRYYRQW